MSEIVWSDVLLWPGDEGAAEIIVFDASDASTSTQMLQLAAQWTSAGVPAAPRVVALSTTAMEMCRRQFDPKAYLGRDMFPLPELSADHIASLPLTIVRPGRDVSRVVIYGAGHVGFGTAVPQLFVDRCIDEGFGAVVQEEQHWHPHDPSFYTDEGDQVLGPEDVITDEARLTGSQSWLFIDVPMRLICRSRASVSAFATIAPSVRRDAKTAIAREWSSSCSGPRVSHVRARATGVGPCSD